MSIAYLIRNQLIQINYFTYLCRSSPNPVHFFTFPASFSLKSSLPSISSSESSFLCGQSVVTSAFFFHILILLHFIPFIGKICSCSYFHLFVTTSWHYNLFFTSLIDNNLGRFAKYGSLRAGTYVAFYDQQDGSYCVADSMRTPGTDVIDPGKTQHVLHEVDLEGEPDALLLVRTAVVIHKDLFSVSYCYKLQLKSTVQVPETLGDQFTYHRYEWSSKAMKGTGRKNMECLSKKTSEQDHTREGDRVETKKRLSKPVWPVRRWMGCYSKSVSPLRSMS